MGVLGNVGRITITICPGQSGAPTVLLGPVLCDFADSLGLMGCERGAVVCQGRIGTCMVFGGGRVVILKIDGI